MASLNKNVLGSFLPTFNPKTTLTVATNNNLLDNILPTFGNLRVQVPVWDEDQRMFICDEYESANGHRYYKGVRFCDRLVMVENVGLYHTCTYIDSIELYSFNGQNISLIQKRDYDKVFRAGEFVRKESEIMLRNYFVGALRTQNINVIEKEFEEQIKSIIDSCYKSFLDKDYDNISITQILPLLKQN